MKDIRDLLYDTHWQVLRVSLKGDWSPTLDGVERNLRKLLAYVEDAKDERELYYRLLRVINLLNATMMGYNGMGMGQSALALRVSQIRNPLQETRDELQKRYVNSGLPDWNWDEQEKQLQRLRNVDPMMFHYVLVDLAGRLRKYGAAHRPGLARFVRLMQKLQ